MKVADGFRNTLFVFI